MTKQNKSKQELEDEAVLAVLLSEQEVTEGKILYGDIRELLKNHPLDSIQDL